tara:strand:- start:7375 stop:7884 length:510 start_codon:yes stop_codon:yes gene_type:complete
MVSARIAAVVVTALTGSATLAQAACPQALGVYREAASGAEISFSGTLSEADGMQHRFSLSFAGNGVRMDGVVMMAGEPDRPWGVILHDCPEGDATGAEIEACTVWQGTIYAIDAKGGTGWLPVPGADHTAGENLLLPEFGAAVMRSAAWRDGTITATPGDVFRLTGCQE